jgi:hypothetical protein
LHYRTKRASINMLEAIPTCNFIDHYATLKKYRKHSLCNTWWPMDVQVVDIVGMTSGNSHTRTREFDVVRSMRFITCPWWKVNTMFGRTKHLLTLEMKNQCHEWVSKSKIGNGCHKLGNIPRKMRLPQKELNLSRPFC